MAAVLSYLDAKAHRGQWHLRIDDIDTPRVVPGAADLILRTLERFGLHWHGQVVYQSQRHAAYRDRLQQLHQQGATFFCQCSRAQLQGQPRYPGHCRHRRHLIANTSCAYAIRVNTAQAPAFECADRIQGRQWLHLAAAGGDFIVHRADGLYAYTFATVVDDHDLRVTHVVRGIDLLPTTAAQAYLYHLLGLPLPCYAHFPLVTVDTRKLGKSTGAPGIHTQPVRELLLWILQQLGYDSIPDGSIDEVLDWAAAHWQLDRLRRHSTFELSDRFNANRPGYLCD